ncbi:MAG: fructosamine kinase family protein [Chloroflexaceae bacterium]|nr:fructosamine kinase family protein [Chloroflexaceae bacterium]
MWTEIARQIANATGSPFEIQDRRSVSGGCINQGYALIGKNCTYFVKINRPVQVEMFAAEALGLRQILATQTIRAPQPLCWGTTEQSSYLVMEWLEFGPGSGAAWEAMGRQLAHLHRQGQGTQYGWERNNTIGATPQINPWTDHWADFFTEQRLGFQLHLANRRGGHFSDTILEAIRQILGDRQPQPSLVHGDLWSGNAAVLVDGTPVILDPAVYYGDREVDIAMTELFGGFPGSFYQGYNRIWPLETGYQQRKVIYNLYHILNHFNLFGGGYGDQAQRMMHQILST